jgi:endonuclease-3 related protein
MNDLEKIYQKLYSSYGPQGWWPITRLTNKKKINITKSGSISGYHPKDYSIPDNDLDRFEIIVGAVLTQNTNWISVEKAIKNLHNLELMSAEKSLILTLKK